MQKLQAPAEETQSYQTASSGMDGGQTLGSNWRLGVGSGRWRSTKPSTAWKAANYTAWDSVWLSFGKSGNTCVAKIIVD